MSVDQSATEKYLLASFQERFAILSADPNAKSWGSLRWEAVGDVLGPDASEEQINALLQLAKSVK
jgi:hypothetical protein